MELGRISEWPGISVLLSLGILVFSQCETDKPDLVSVECTLDPSRLIEAKQILIRAPDVGCPAPCDAAYILAELAKLPEYGRCGTITLAGRAVATDTNITVAAVKPSSSVATFLFETSGSMNGYLAQEAGLKNHLANLIQRAQSPLEPLVGSLNLGYIGSRVKPYTGPPMDFRKTLMKGKLPGDAGATSDIAALVKQAFAKTGSDSAIVLVSDLVFSPDKSAIANDYLDDQSLQIRQAVEQSLAADPDFSVALLRAESSFKGIYYCANDKEVKVETDRPYFMLFAGPRRLVVALVKSATEVTSGDAISFFGAASEPGFEIQKADPTSKFGTYQLSPKPTTPPSIKSPEGATAGQTKGQLVVPIRVDLSSLADPEAAAKQLSSDKRFEFASLEKLTKTSPEGYTHELRIKRAGTQYTGTTVIELARAASTSTLDAYYIDSNPCTAAELGDKTYGLEQLVNGLSFAYRNFTQQPAATLTFSINK